MKTKILIIALCILATTLLTGCLGGGGGSAGSSGGGIQVAGLPGSGSDTGILGGNPAGGDSILGGSGSDGGTLPNNPEPATALLLGSGLAAYAFLQRKKKK